MIGFTSVTTGWRIYKNNKIFDLLEISSRVI